MSALGELPRVDVAIHADTTHERAATYAFAAEWTPWLEVRGVKVATVMGAQPPEELLSFKTDIPAFTMASGKAGKLRRQCTSDWKIAPIKRYLQAHRNGVQVEQWLGITKDEWHRAKDSDVKYIVHRFPLLELGMTRGDCLEWLSAHNLPSPGKSSCTFCPFHSKRAWQQIKREGGPDWEEAVRVDDAIRNKRPPFALYIHSSRVPLAEAVTIPEDSGYSQLDMLASDDVDAECDSGHCFL